MPVLDTCFLIHLEADHPAAVDALRHIDEQVLVVPYQVALEYAIGVRDVDEALLALQGGFIVDRPEPPVLRQAAHLGAVLRAKGQRVPVADTWIAAAARVRDDYVVTTNKRDFTRLGVDAWHYEKEPAPPGPVGSGGK